MPSYIQTGYIEDGYFATVSSPTGVAQGDEYARLAVSRLVGQFEKSTKLQSLVCQICNALDVLAFDVDNVGNKRWIDTAEGVQLDGCGYIVGVQRQGRSDEEYRKWLKFRIFVNVSNATPSDLIRGLKFLTGPVDCQYQESYPATALLFTDGFEVPLDIQDQMQDLAPVAVSALPVAVSFGNKPFRFANPPQLGELFVNNSADYLTANESDILVSSDNLLSGDYPLGGCTPSDFNIGGNTYIEANGAFLAVYNPNTAQTLGHDILTGVYQ